MPAPRFAFSFQLLASGAVLFAGSIARAEDPCTTDTDCAHGFSCQVIATSDCASPACPPNADCPAPAPCVAETIKGCRPLANCSAHSDCADGWVCYEDTQQNCATAPAEACPPGVPCTKSLPPPPDCTTVTTRSCVPRYALPCNADADCGATGFTCVLDSGG